MEEIHEEAPAAAAAAAAAAGANPNPKSEEAGERREGEEEIEEIPEKSKVPRSSEVEVHLYRSGKGPIEVFRSKLGGWDQDRLEVQDILDKYGFKAVFAFSPASGRGVPLAFSLRNGRSFASYSDGSVIHVDGEPKDPLVKPITKIMVGVAVVTLLIAIFVKETPQWFNISKLTNNTFPPWVICCAIIAFTRLRKRTRNLLRKFGW